MYFPWVLQIEEGYITSVIRICTIMSYKSFGILAYLPIARPARVTSNMMHDAATAVAATSPGVQ